MIITPDEILIPKNKVLKYKQEARFHCVCGTSILIRSRIPEYHKVKCKCNLVYEVFNNSDGSGLRFRIKGYLNDF